MTPDELRALAGKLRKLQAGEAYEAADYLRACAEAQPVPAVPAGWQLMLDSHRRLVEQAIQSAEHPSGMSTHDGKARIDASILRRMLAIIDSLSAAPQAEPSAALIRAYNSGYMQGHHDTVEAQFIDIHPLDMDTYHADVVAELGLSAAPQAEPKREPVSDSRPCTCHPDDSPPVPCARKYALSECRAVSGEPTEAQIEARDALLDFISENGTASEGVQHYLDRYVRAALAAKEKPE